MGEPATIKPPITETEVVGDIDNHIDDLEVVIKGICKPLTISINGEWGAGKTTFLTHWQKRRPKNSISIDAFATDFINNPLAVILSEFSKHFQKEKLFKEILKPKLDIEKVKKNTTTEILKLLTYNIIDLNTSQGVNNEIVIRIDDFRNFKEAIAKFKKILSNSQRKKEKLYIFVDELDRCRPTYAVEFIEIVKHFFEIDNTVFIFAINKKELCSSIKHVQGCENPDRYLKKFFNFNYDLPVLSSKDFIQYLVRKNEFGIGSDCCKEDFIDTFAFFAEKLELHPRDIEQSYATLIIALKKIGKNEHCPFIYPLIFLTIIREGKKEYKEHYEYLVARNLPSNTVMPNINKIDDMKLGTIDSKLHQVWMELCISPLSKFRSTSLESDLKRVMDLHSRGESPSRVDKEVFEKAVKISNKTANLGNKLPQEALNKGTLAKYIDSLLNFSNKFNKGEA
jgi:hypothetical protein